MIRLLRIVWVEVRWWAESFGYWLRPYDMLADARRWRWQPRQRCGWSQLAHTRVDHERLWRALREDKS